jgi:iron complex transport system substrate-binding protein
MEKGGLMNKMLCVFLYMPILLLPILICACSQSGDKGNAEDNNRSFIQLGEFTLQKVSPGRTEVRDGAGRRLVLVPKNAPAPGNVDSNRLIRTPVKHVAAYGAFNVSVLKALGVLETTLVGSTYPTEKWHIPEVRNGMKSGKIAFLGSDNSIDFERLDQVQPDLVLTWDRSIIPMLNDLDIPCVITSSTTAMCLNTRMRFVKFLAPFFHREDKARSFLNRVNTALTEIREQTHHAGPPFKVMWGDIYEKRVLVEPGNAWVAELINTLQSDYLFDDVFGTSCIEINVERFLYSGKEADILFTYRTPEQGATSKKALARLNPILSGIRPLNEGKVYAPLPHYAQSYHRLDEILKEIAAILYPELYKDYSLRYFMELPETNPETRRRR